MLYTRKQSEHYEAYLYICEFVLMRKFVRW